MSQTERILYHLKHKGGLTPLDALSQFGSFRLGARINDLRNEGFDIRTIMVKDDQNGKRYAKYVLNEAAGHPGAKEQPLTAGSDA